MRSSAVLLKCREAYLFVTRAKDLFVFPGYTALPGGKCETGESFEDALVREIQEELSLQIDPKQLISIGYAKTPDFIPYQFETRYFLYELENCHIPAIIHDEFSKIEWLTLDEVLDQYSSGDRLMVAPMLSLLNKDHHHEGFQHHYQTPEGEVPSVSILSELYQVMPESQTLPPATRTNAFIIGKTLIDPSPVDEEFEKFSRTISQHLIEKVVISHHHFDHHQNAVRICESLQVPLWISADSKRRIEQKIPNYFRSVELIVLEEGAVIGEWKGEKVIAFLTPGHDEGQFSFYPQSKRWMIVGDLFQGVGTVVIGTNEGDMQKYFSTLQQVIDMNPGCVIPSHGIPLGGVSIIQRTLEHRKRREAEVLKLSHLNEAEIRDYIYPKLDPRLYPLALENIRSHMIKLRAEGKIS